jgi:O-antigen ligase
LGTIGLVAILGVVGLFVWRPHVYERQINSTIATAQNIGTSAYGVIWRRSLHIASEHPIFGIGMGQFRTECRKPIYGPYDASNLQTRFYCDAHPHHVYLEWTVEGGLIGLALFVLGIGALFRRFWRHAWATPLNLAFVGACVTLAIRLFPLSTSPGLMRAWSAIPLWMMMGWAFSYVYASENKTNTVPSPANRS